jgi:hypothetical protein
LIIIVLRFGPRLYFQRDRGFEDDDDDTESEGNDSIDEQNNNAAGNNLDAGNLELSYVMKYGATDPEQGESEAVGLLLQEGLRDRNANATQNRASWSKDNPFISWLTKLNPIKDRNQPPNPYKELTADQEVMRLITRKKSMMKKAKSGVSFCT